MLILSECSFMMSTHDFTEVPVDEIQEILNHSEDGNELIGILRRVKFDAETSVCYEDRLSYYEDLINKIMSNVTKQYSDEEKEICLAYLVCGRFLDDELVYSFCDTIIKKYAESINTMCDEAWFLYEKIRYDLLQHYARSNSWEHPVIRELVTELKKNKARYENLSSIYGW